MRADAHGREAAGIAKLENAVKRRLRLQARARGPTGRGIGRADRGRADIAHGWVGKGADHLAQVAGLRHMVGIKLCHDVVIAIAPMVVEIGKVALLAAGAARPCLVVIARIALAAGNPDAVARAPCAGQIIGVFIGQPCVMRVILRQHGVQRGDQDRQRL